MDFILRIDKTTLNSIHDELKRLFFQSNDDTESSSSIHQSKITCDQFILASSNVLSDINKINRNHINNDKKITRSHGGPLFDNQQVLINELRRLFDVVDVDSLGNVINQSMIIYSLMMCSIYV